MSSDQDRIERVCEHIGMEAWPRLKLVAEHFSAAFKCMTYVYGSCLRTKNWQDIDLMLEFDYNRYCQISQPGWGTEAGAIVLSALSMYATQIVGARVEVHSISQAMPFLPNLLLAKVPS